VAITDLLIRLAAALALGGAIGLERELSQKPAGLRTNILICAGAAMMMALSEMVLARAGGGGFDPLRVAAGVITGIGFMGAGSIMRAGGHVQGLTTASTLWAVTALGLVAGAGYLLEAGIFAALIILTLVAFRRVEAAVPKKGTVTAVLRVADMDEAPDRVAAVAARHGIELEMVELKRAEGGVLMAFTFLAAAAKERALRRDLAAAAEIIELRK
jgi:putative Mg2+ transporter-C (MgtC) family protein